LVKGVTFDQSGFAEDDKYKEEHKDKTDQFAKNKK